MFRPELVLAGSNVSIYVIRTSKMQDMLDIQTHPAIDQTAYMDA
jgi:hypothetical protein